MRIDTLQISEDLKKAGADSKIAKELAHQFKLIREDIISKEEAEEKLATKIDIENIKLKIEKTKSSLLKWMVGLFIGLFVSLTGTISAICFAMVKVMVN